LRHEVKRLLTAVESVRGVREVENLLDIYEKQGEIPALQGGAVRTGARSELLQTNWSPAARVLVGAAGLVLLAGGAAKRGAIGASASLAGLAALARAVTNKELSRIIGMQIDGHSVEIRKTINIEAPLDEVWEYWADYDSFPLFMSNVVEVSDLGNGRSHWVVKGPAGSDLEWNAVITEFEPERELSWESEAEAPVQNRGTIKFARAGEESTRVDIMLEYTPPAGVIGHAAAAILGRDPRSLIDQDLLRMKSLIEHGKTTAEGRRVHSDNIH